MEDGALDALERWFVARGLPHFVERHDSAAVIWARAVPLLIPAYVLLGLNALQVGREQWSAAANVAVAAFVVVVLLTTWVLANVLRHRPALDRPRRIGAAELAVFVLAPAVPAALLGQWRDAAEAIVGAVVLLAAIWALTSYGVWPLLHWAVGRAGAQLGVLFNVVVRALPLLLLFTTFLFINAEVWQVAGTLTGLPYVGLIAVFVLLGAVFLLSRLPSLMRDLNHFESWSEIRQLVDGTPADALAIPGDGMAGPPPTADRPTLRQRLNIGLVTLFSQSIQITMVAATLGVFFVGFGVLAIPESTIASWTALDDVQVFARFTVSGRDLVLSEPLLRVAGFLAAFTGMYFTVQLSTDASYREEFAEDVAPDLRQALAARSVYRRALAAAGGRESRR